MRKEIDSTSFDSSITVNRPLDKNITPSNSILSHIDQNKKELCIYSIGKMRSLLEVEVNLEPRSAPRLLLLALAKIRKLSKDCVGGLVWTRLSNHLFPGLQA